MRAWVRWALLDTSARPRVLLRLALHTVGVLLASLPGVGLEWLFGRSEVVRALAFALHTSMVVLVTWAAARWLDRRPFQALTGRLDRRALVEVLLGLSLGVGLIAAVALVERGAGLAAYEVRAPALRRIVASLLFFVFVSIEEELWFRGYQVTNLAEALEAYLGRRGARATALVSSAILFGLAHATNPNASWISTANITVGGLLLGVSFAITGRLGIAVGLHTGWNVTQCWLDMPVSGQALYDDLFLAREERGEDWLTGGAFGPEGGALGLAAMVLGTLGLAGLGARRRRELDGPSEGMASGPR